MTENDKAFLKQFAFWTLIFVFVLPIVAIIAIFIVFFGGFAALALMMGHFA